MDITINYLASNIHSALQIEEGRAHELFKKLVNIVNNEATGTVNKALDLAIKLAEDESELAYVMVTLGQFAERQPKIINELHRNNPEILN